jgi:hypothetical protein
MATESKTVYEVHLVEGIDDVPATVTSGLVDFYDSGVWVRRDDGARDFFPYERITHIRERPGEGDELDDLEFQ